MAINIGSSSINSIYVGNTEVKSVYLGDNLVYSKQSEPVIEIDDSYNYYVFDTSKVSGSTTVKLQDCRNSLGDTTTWDDKLTDWGDGTINTSKYHTYDSNGTYTVKTKYMINKTFDGDYNTQRMLTQCLNINKNITNYNCLFHRCDNLVYVYTKRLNTNKVTDMSYMFNGCSRLKSLDLSSFDTSNVTNMDRMIGSCFNLTSVNLSNFNTNSVSNMNNMFYYCYNLIYLNLSNFNINNTTTTNNMLYNCTKLTIDNIIMTNCNDATKKKIQEALAAK